MEILQVLRELGIEKLKQKSMGVSPDRDTRVRRVKS